MQLFARNPAKWKTRLPTPTVSRGVYVIAWIIGWAILIGVAQDMTHFNRHAVSVVTGELTRLEAAVPFCRNLQCRIPTCRGDDRACQKQIYTLDRFCNATAMCYSTGRSTDKYLYCDERDTCVERMKTLSEKIDPIETTLNSYLGGFFLLVGFLYRSHFEPKAPRLPLSQTAALLFICTSAVVTMWFGYMVRKSIVDQLTEIAVLPNPGYMIDLVVDQVVATLATSIFAIAALAATGDAKMMVEQQAANAAPDTNALAKQE